MMKKDFLGKSEVYNFFHISAVHVRTGVNVRVYGHYAPAILILVHLQLCRNIIVQFLKCKISVSPYNFYILSYDI